MFGGSVLVILIAVLIYAALKACVKDRKHIVKEVRELHPIEQVEIAKEGAEAIISVAPQYEPKLTHKSTKRSKLDIEDDTFGGKSFDRSSIDKRATLVGIRASEIMSEHSARSKNSQHGKHKSNSSMSSQSHMIDEEAS